jgi:hypothetical protein
VGAVAVDGRDVLVGAARVIEEVPNPKASPRRPGVDALELATVEEAVR